MHAVQHITGRNSTYLSRLNEKLTVSARVHDILYFLGVLKEAFRRAFDHDAFAVGQLWICRSQALKLLMI
jgi:hypothetical protein